MDPELPHLNRLQPIGLPDPSMCRAGWFSRLLSGAPGFVFVESIKAMCLQSSTVELALILYYDGLAYRPGLN